MFIVDHEHSSSASDTTVLLSQSSEEEFDSPPVKLQKYNESPDDLAEVNTVFHQKINKNKRNHY